MPQITKAALRKDGGQEYINRLITFVLLGAAAVCVVLACAIPPAIAWLGSSWEDPQQLALATSFAYLLLPQVFFFAMYTVLGEVLNNLLSIAGLLLFIAIMGGDPDGVRGAGMWGFPGVFLVAGFGTLGVAVQAICLLLFFGRAGLRFRLDLRFRGTGLGIVLRLGTWTFGNVLVSQLVALAMNQAMNRAQGGEAGIAAWQLTSLIAILPHSIIVVSLVTSRFTRMSAAAAEGRTDSLRFDLVELSKTTIVLMSAVIVAMAVLALPITRVIMLGASPSAWTPVATVLLCHLAGALGFSLVFVLGRGFFATSDTRTPFLIQAGQSAVALLVVATSALLPSESVTATITLALNLLFWVQAAATFLVLRRRLIALGERSAGGRSILLTLLQCAAAALLAAAAGWGVLQALGGTAPGGFVMGSPWSALGGCATVTAAMLPVYLGALLLMRNDFARGLMARRPR